MGLLLFGRGLLLWVLLAMHVLSLGVENGGYSLVVAHGLLTVLASLVAEHML